MGHFSDVHSNFASAPGANKTRGKGAGDDEELQLNNSELRSDEMLSGYVGKTQKNEYDCPISRYTVLVARTQELHAQMRRRTLHNYIIIA
ncbi:hypothetical protein DPX16_19508 [Anabarilius grahami]|uniref:Uncharacterized protein n=1 Tax=Anabarilius grahami TaxID=495550 RepID=A0A3N0Y7S2_ANAGA|nr:hypothetical protein DPX16_19508 [Anabarilius grahami]